MKFPTLYKKSSTGKISEWIVEVENDSFRTISGFTDGLKVTSAFTKCVPKNMGKKNSTTPAFQAMQEAQAMFDKRKELGSFENIKHINNAVYFKPMLAHKLEDYIDSLKFPVGSQPKLDGIRCIAKEDGLWTRTGKQIISAPHIYEALRPLFDVNPDLILDGELYCDKLNNDFNKIISLVRKSKPTPKDLDESKDVIQYHIYDLPSSDYTFEYRIAELQHINFPDCCVVVSTYVLSSKKEIKKQYEIYMEQGYEGQIIRDPSGKYQNKRSKYLLKDKEFVDAEFVIKGVNEGIGNLKGKIGTLNFGNFNAAVNGDWEYLEMLFKAKDLIGKPATVRYQNLTPDGIPRFGKVIAIRDYEN